MLNLTERSKQLEKLFKDYHNQFSNSSDLHYEYIIRSGSGIGINVYIRCVENGIEGDITDYSMW